MRLAPSNSVRLALLGTLVYLVFAYGLIELARSASWGQFSWVGALGVSAGIVFGLVYRLTVRLKSGSKPKFGEGDREVSIVGHHLDGVWRARVDPPLPLDLPLDDKVDWMYRHARYVEANDAFTSMYGAVTSDELLGRPLEDTMPRSPRNDAVLRRFFEEGLQSRGAVSQELAVDGREILIRSNVYSKTEQGALCQVWGSQLDVTDESRALTAIQRQERLLLNAERLAEIGSWTYDPNTEALEWSENFYRLCGVEPADHQPTRDSVLASLHRDDRAGWYESLRRTAVDGVPFEREVRFFRPDGSMRHYHTRVEPIVENGRVVQVIGIARDVTRRRRTEAAQAELELQVRQLQRLEAIGTLAGGIAHDFNNILSAVMGYTDIAIGELPQGHAARHALHEIEKASLRARDLIEQILSYSRKMDHRQRPVEIDQLVTEVLGLLRASLPATVEIREQLRASGLNVLADGSQLHQVIVNLCTNAAQAMPGGGRMTIGLDHFRSSEPLNTVTAQLPAGAYVRLRVTDTGHGMDETTIERMFEPFFTTKGPGQGTGLGLSTVNGIVAEHQGGIDVRSVLGQGTTFEVFLPVAEVGAPDADSGHAAQGSVELGTVLLLDDEIALMTLGERMLDRLGYRAVAFSSAIAALEAFRRQPERFDLVITDLRMVEMSGIELAREIRQVAPDIPLVLATGYSNEEIDRLVEGGLFRGLLEKPFNLKTLGKCIADAMSRRPHSTDSASTAKLPDVSDSHKGPGETIH